MTENVKTSSPASSQTALATLAIVMGVGLLAIVAFALRSGTMDYSPWSVLGVGVLVAGAAALGGGLLGFLFGIPRASTNSNASASYRANTNLEDISDWLTKILVGVGLTQVTAFPKWIKALATFFAPGLGGSMAAPTFAIVILLHFMVSGFLFAYLWTRLFLAGALAQADQRALMAIETKLKQSESETRTLAKAVDDIKKQTEDDSRALLLTEKQLALPTGVPDLPFDELKAAVAAASVSARVQIYNRAHTVRGSSWREAATKATMERTIPIFRALIAADAEAKYHGNHGQLGFALKDQREPAWGEAEAELNEAIRIRGPWQDKGWTYYELNRAVCRIAQDRAFKQDRPSAKDVQDAVLTDLRAAHVDLASVIPKIQEITRWLDINDLTMADLEGSERSVRRL